MERVLASPLGRSEARSVFGDASRFLAMCDGGWSIVKYNPHLAHQETGVHVLGDSLSQTV